jgi:hypothetical protein
MKNKIIIPIIIAIIFAGGGFYGGITYQKSQAPVRGSFVGSPSTGSGQNGQNRFGAGGGFTTGTVLSKDAASITLQLPNNAGSKIIFYTASTPVMKSVAGTPADLAVGDRVSVTGSANSDGSVSAQSIMEGNFGFGTTTRASGQ